MSVDRYPFSHNLHGAKAPIRFKGQVSAGSTATINAGTLCTYNETSGVFIEATAAADAQYSLAIAAQKQEAADAARYIDFYALTEHDVWQLDLSAAAAVALGDALEISDSETLTRNVDGIAVAYSVSDDHYPMVGVTLPNKSTVRCIFDPSKSYWYKNTLQRGLLKVMAKTADYTITLEDNGAVITNKGATGTVVLTAPTSVVPVGFHFWQVTQAAYTFTFDPKPNGASVIAVGAIQTAGKAASTNDEGESTHWYWDGTDWGVLGSSLDGDADLDIES